MAGNGRSLALNGDLMTKQLEIEQVLADPAASFWLKDALSSALARDPWTLPTMRKCWPNC
jgi:hypothetical protein